MLKCKVGSNIFGIQPIKEPFFVPKHIPGSILAIKIN